MKSEEDTQFSAGSGDNIVRLRGLPWSTRESELREFLSACNIKAIHFTFTREGRASGEAYVELETEQDTQLALLKHKQNLKNRYIEVLTAKRTEMSFVLQKANNLRNQSAGNQNNVVRLRGLPFGATGDDIQAFFEGMVIAPDGIIRPIDKTGRLTGEAYVKFLDKETTDRALDKHMKEIGNRYIEVFRSTDDECYRAQYPNGGGPEDDLYFGKTRGIPSLLDFFVEEGPPRGPRATSRLMKRERERERERSPPGFMRGRSSLYTIGCATGHLVHLRGLPFRCTASDIVEFFSPLKVLNVLILFDEKSGRALGQADVEFLTHADAMEAMKKNKEHIGDRYVDLFLDSKPPPPGPRPMRMEPVSLVPRQGENGQGVDAYNTSVSGTTTGPATAEYSTDTYGQAYSTATQGDVVYSQQPVQYPGYDTSATMAAGYYGDPSTADPATAAAAAAAYGWTY